MDMIIPLSKESTRDNFELKMLLRSIERHCSNVGTIYIATMYPPTWLNRDSNIVVVPIEDTEPHNKDANLHKKILGVIEKYNLKKFVFSADDNAFLQDVDLEHIPMVHNRRNISMLKEHNKWERRLINTLRFGESRGIKLNCNFEAHCPMEFDAQKVYNGMQGVDYCSQPGLTICTCWKIVSNDCANIGAEQTTIKVTMENGYCAEFENLQDGKVYLGYNDNAMECGLGDKLLKLFPSKSKYETKSKYEM